MPAVPDPTAGRATDADLAGIGITLAAAFHDDPVSSHLLPVSASRRQRATRASDTGTSSASKGGPTTWSMWREPRSG
jgi:hypothetical protein